MFFDRTSGVSGARTFKDCNFQRLVTAIWLLPETRYTPAGLEGIWEHLYTELYIHIWPNVQEQGANFSHKWI